MFDLGGKVALVTGASGSLGWPISKALAGAGADVACHCYKNREKVDSLASEIRGMGRKSTVIQADLTDAAKAEWVIEQTVKELGNIHILVNNAGISKDSLLIKHTPELVDEILRNNLISMFYITQPAARIMAKNRWGRLIHIGSVVTYMGSHAQSAYAASKAGVMGMSRGIAREMGRRGITSNVVAPGFISAGMSEAMSDLRKEQLMPLIAVGRTGRVEEVAAAVVFLASEEAGYITGTVLHVNGGMYM
jgi:3-oxoacyl-[acyl-carrier protein] reductase